MLSGSQRSHSLVVAEGAGMGIRSQGAEPEPSHSVSCCSPACPEPCGLPRLIPPSIAHLLASKREDFIPPHPSACFT